MRIDPAIVADEVLLDVQGGAGDQPAAPSRVTATTTDDVRVAFAE